MASIHLHGYITARCDCGWFIEDTVRPVKEASGPIRCRMCGKVYIVHPPKLEEVPDG